MFRRATAVWESARSIRECMRMLLYADAQSAEYTRDVELYLAYCRQHHGEDDKALEIYNGIVARDASPDVLYLRGKLYMDLGNTEAASEDFDRAASLSDDYDLFINIYEVYASHDKKADGSSFLERALQIVSDSEKDYYNKGLVHYYLQNYEESKTNLISALDEDPSTSARKSVSFHGTDSRCQSDVQ